MNLTELALKHGTDKAGHHNYTPYYERHLGKWWMQQVTLLELGIGGYHHIDRGGEGLRMWAEYFSKGKIIGVDLHKKEIKLPSNACVYQCDQTDADGLNRIIEIEKVPDIIVDDASHINPLTIKSFQILFPKLKPGGVYVIEDTESSYWSAVATDGTDFKGGNHSGTVMNYFKRVLDMLNVEHIIWAEFPELIPMPCLKEIESIHFYKEMIFIHKKA